MNPFYRVQTESGMYKYIDTEQGHISPCPSPENHWQCWQKSGLLPFLLNTIHISNIIGLCIWLN